MKLIQICAVPATVDEASFVVALDDQGGVWESIYDGNKGGWREWERLPTFPTGRGGS